MIDAAVVLAAYDELRGSMPHVPPGRARRARRAARAHGSGGRTAASSSTAISPVWREPSLDELIARQVRIFAARHEPFEWKLHGHDRPADLPDRLRAAGFVADPQETVLAAATSAVAAEPVVPRGMVLREVTEQADFDRVAALESRIWGDGQTLGLGACWRGGGPSIRAR